MVGLNKTYTGVPKATIDLRKADEQLLEIINESNGEAYETSTRTTQDGRKFATLKLKNKIRTIEIEWTDSANPICYTEVNKECCTGLTTSGFPSFVIVLKQNDAEKRFDPIRAQVRITRDFNANNEETLIEGPLSISSNDSSKLIFDLAPRSKKDPSIKMSGVCKTVERVQASSTDNATKNYAIQVGKQAAVFFQALANAAMTSGACAVSPDYSACFFDPSECSLQYPPLCCTARN